AAREQERRIDIVERPLPGGLNEWKEWRRKRRRDTGLLDPGHAVTRAQGKAIGEPHSQPDPWSKVQLFEIPRRARKPVLSQVVELLGLQIEHGSPVIDDGGREVQGVTNAKVQSQPSRRFEVVLEEEFADFGTRL